MANVILTPRQAARAEKLKARRARKAARRAGLIPQAPATINARKRNSEMRAIVLRTEAQ